MGLRNIIAACLCTLAMTACSTAPKQTTVPTPVQPRPRVVKPVKNPANYPLSQDVKYTGSRHNFTLEATLSGGYQVKVELGGITTLYDPSGKLPKLVFSTVSSSKDGYKVEHIVNKSDVVDCWENLISQCSTEELKEANRLLKEALEVTKYKPHLKYWQATDAKGILGKWRGKKLK